MSLNLNETLASVVAARGADRAFGVPGGGSNLDLIDACARREIGFVLMHSEAAAAIAAATYGHLSGVPAVALATRGPGAASAVNGAATATLDRLPLLLVTDTVASGDRSSVAHQRIDQPALLAPVTKWSGTLGVDRPERTVERSIELAAAWPPGAVHLDVDPTADGDVPSPVRTPAPAARMVLEAAAARVGEATRAIVIIGVGALIDPLGVSEIVSRLGWPVLTTYQASGVVSSNEPIYAGLFTNSAFDHRFLATGDLVLTIGLDPVELLPGRFPPSIPVVSISTWPHAAQPTENSISVSGALLDTLVEITAAANIDPESRPRAASHRDAVRTILRPTQRAFGPLEVVREVRRALPGDASVTVDAGAHFLPIMPGIAATEPSSVLISNGLATMGFALPAAIAAALSRRGRPVVAMTGDGGLGMVLAELETLARLRLPVTVVVFNDSALSLIALKQRPGGAGEHAVSYGPTDFAAVARGMGIDAATVRSSSELRERLERGWHEPRLIDARIDPSDYGRLFAELRG